MKKIIFILLILLSGTVFAQKECYNPYPIVLRTPVQPLKVPVTWSSNPENYEILGYTLKIEGIPPYRIKGNVVMTKMVKEELERNCKNQCKVNIKELVVRRKEDGQIFTLGGDVVIYTFYYTSEQ